MAGSIFFGDEGWHNSSSNTYFVYHFLIERLPDGPNKAELEELDNEDVPILNLSDPAKSEVVDFIANDLSGYLDTLDEADYRDALKTEMAELIALAKQQQARNTRAKTADGGK